MAENELRALPELPDPYYGPDTHVDEEGEGAFTADQMRAYASAALASAPEPQGVAWRDDCERMPASFPGSAVFLASTLRTLVEKCRPGYMVSKTVARQLSTAATVAAAFEHAAQSPPPAPALVPAGLGVSEPVALVDLFQAVRQFRNEPALGKLTGLRGTPGYIAMCKAWEELEDMPRWPFQTVEQIIALSDACGVTYSNGLVGKIEDADMTEEVVAFARALLAAPTKQEAPALVPQVAEACPAYEHVGWIDPGHERPLSIAKREQLDPLNREHYPYPIYVATHRQQAALVPQVSGDVGARAAHVLIAYAIAELAQSADEDDPFVAFAEEVRPWLGEVEGLDVPDDIQQTVRDAIAFVRATPSPLPVGGAEPLTEERIVDIWAGVSTGESDEINIVDLARAIERAHGIGEKGVQHG